VDRITSGAEGVTVDVTLLSPGNFCPEHAEFTGPAVMVLHRRATPDRPVRFVEHHETPVPCGPPTGAHVVADTRPVPVASRRDTAPGDSIEVIYAAGQSGLGTPLRQVVYDSATFAALWRRAHSYNPTQPLPPLPNVDFTRDEVIVAAMGGQGSPASSLQIRKVERSDFALTVFIELHQRHGCIEPTVVVYPAVMVRLRRSVGLATVFADHFSFTTPC
jgi:hypothetical protein